MHADASIFESRRGPHSAPANAGRDPWETVKETDTEEESCPAFGFLRGLRDRALMIEFRLRGGNSETYPYGWLASVRYNPSVGLLLKFTGDLVTLVLIRGSNLDAIVKDRGINLTERGLQRHRVVYVREMDEDEVRKTPQGQPTIDHIDIAEFESPDEQREWLKKMGPVFVRV
jgi:hypothetical protein